MAAIFDFRSKRFELFFDLQVTMILPTKFRVSWPFGSGDEGKIYCRNGRHGGQFGFSVGNDYIYFLPKGYSGTSNQVSSQLVFWFRRQRGKYIFKEAAMAATWDFSIKTLVAIFDLQVTLILLTKFRVNWHFGSEEEVQNRFSRWRPWRPSWIYDRNDFSYF